MGKVAQLLPEYRTIAGPADHALVFAHGIRMDVDALRPFAKYLEKATGGLLDIWLFDYDWTRPLTENGERLAAKVAKLNYRQVSLLGYSMGGLVARLAATHHNPTIRTIITMATPNRGALTVAQLAPLGQTVLDVMTIGLISPMVRCHGIRDLTRAGEIMIERRGEQGVEAAVTNKRYASVPALFFHPSRHYASRDTSMGVASAIIEAIPFSRLRRPHDGIVTEDSNNLVERGSTDWSEVDYASYDGVSPARGHVVHIDARERDHSTILLSRNVAGIVAELLTTEDWRDVSQSPDVKIDLA